VHIAHVTVDWDRIINVQGMGPPAYVHSRRALIASVCLLAGLSSEAVGQTQHDSLEIMVAFGRRIELETEHFQYRLGIGANFLPDFRRAAHSSDPGQLPSAALVAAAVRAISRPILIIPLVRNPTPEIAAERRRTLFARLDRHYWIDSLEFGADSAVLWLCRFTEFHEDSTADMADARYIFRRVQSAWRFERVEVDKFSSLDRTFWPRRPRL
jgi:hypothetical protein